MIVDAFMCVFKKIHIPNICTLNEQNDKGGKLKHFRVFTLKKP